VRIVSKNGVDLSNLVPQVRDDDVLSRIAKAFFPRATEDVRCIRSCAQQLMWSQMKSHHGANYPNSCEDLCKKADAAIKRLGMLAFLPCVEDAALLNYLYVNNAWRCFKAGRKVVVPPIVNPNLEKLVAALEKSKEAAGWLVASDQCPCAEERLSRQEGALLALHEAYEDLAQRDVNLVRFSNHDREMSGRDQYDAWARGHRKALEAWYEKNPSYLEVIWRFGHPRERLQPDVERD